MATVEVTFSPLAAHVRTARLVATAVARRSGVAESLLDEVRLAVGEACSRAVEAHQAHCPAEPVKVALSDEAGRFEIEVINTGGLAPGEAPGRLPSAAAGDAARQKGPAGPPPPGEGGLMPPGFSLAVIAGLADDVQVSETAEGTSVRMSWPLGGPLATDNTPVES
jgi:anti-sigma regulatory factor (Ser/Thr protein kinase)